MNIYKDVISGDEMFSNTFKLSISGLFYEVEGKTVTRTEGFDDALIGANASAEEMTDGNDSSTISGVDIVLNHSLQRVEFTKKSFMAYIKGYVKAIKTHLEKENPDRVEAFKAEAPDAIKKIVANFSNYEFFTGESLDSEGLVGLLDYREDGITPFMLFFKDGLIEEKC
ncbi:translationally-controlled tumor protein homolog [Gymnodraco acuticeps]|nr:PREDICTED: translationally-controlled tumor protein [Notothenia coriiceps]XP_033990210.1 translationally-controlled tumor protein homolog [Trematomus bernacchii]XP_034092795.1 translationally-controlled tumor protein homolog [Gymnodraco acuticeps]KAI9538292.1 tRNA 2'-phosphotransferase [Dissostichus eleginoides]KAJ4933016.1 hypothetical protein JOQ06_029854 [Pogonophryne albipinna]KAK1902728.1 Translationally-controlled tumor protein like [Dissostichus eleginoides]